MLINEHTYDIQNFRCCHNELRSRCTYAANWYLHSTEERAASGPAAANVVAVCSCFSPTARCHQYSVGRLLSGEVAARRNCGTDAPRPLFAGRDPDDTERPTGPI